MIYKGSMMVDFFVEWFKRQLLPALKTPHVIVMDNASFHPKNILDELCIQDRHFFLPLPPYTPEMNPIEQVWKEIRKRGFKNKAFQTLEAVIDKLQEVIQGLEKSVLKSTACRQWARLVFENNI